ncbi:MAG: DNA repair protein RecO [Pseudomonadota bacterium]
MGFWQGNAILLHTQSYNERGSVAVVLSQSCGLYQGFMPQGSIRRKPAGGILRPQPGSIGIASWRSRVDEQLGVLRFEETDSTAARLLGSLSALQAMLAACAVLRASLAERAPCPEIYKLTATLLVQLPDRWRLNYTMWELSLLGELGFGLDLTRCTVTGRANGLTFVSPKTGRAVTRQAAGDYAPRLLPLPEFLAGRSIEGDLDPVQFQQSLQLTGYFLGRHALTKPARNLPRARQLLESADGQS